MIRAGRQLAVLLLVLAMASGSMAGCGKSANAQAEALFREAEDDLKRAADSLASLGDFEEKWEQIFAEGVKPESAGQVRSLLEQSRESEEAALEELREAEKKYGSVEELGDPDAEYLNYARMKLEAVQAQVQALETELEAMQVRLESLEAIERGASLEQSLDYLKRIDQIEMKSREQALRASELHVQAEDYYEEEIDR